MTFSRDSSAATVLVTISNIKAVTILRFGYQTVKYALKFENGKRWKLHWYMKPSINHLLWLHPKTPKKMEEEGLYHKFISIKL